MHLVEEHYYTINKLVLQIFGIWPHYKSRFILFQRMLFIIIIVTYISLQLSVFITTECTMTLFVKTMSLACPFMITVLKYFIFIIKSKSIINLHHQIQEDWKIVQNKLESKIIQKYAHNGQIYTIIIFLFMCVSGMILGIAQLLPDILDIISPLDEPRPRKLLITVEYFVPQANEKYYYTRLLHEIIIVIICTSIIFATATQLLTFACHSFGMFKIASHRIEYTIEDSILHIQDFEKKYAFYKALIHAVIAHRRAMQFSNILVSSFAVPFCIISGFGVISLSISLYGFVEATKISKNMENVAIYLISVITHLIYIFMVAHMGQKVTDYNNDLFKLAPIFRYNTSWYLLPVPSQKLILFLMQSASKDFYFTIGLIFTAKMETSATLVNTALSYVAVMFSCIKE